MNSPVNQSLKSGFLNMRFLLPRRKLSRFYVKLKINFTILKILKCSSLSISTKPCSHFDKSCSTSEKVKSR